MDYSCLRRSLKVGRSDGRASKVHLRNVEVGAFSRVQCASLEENQVLIAR